MKTHGFFLLRRPLLSSEILLGFHKAAGNDPDLFESYLKLIFSDSLLQQALHLASPQMHGQLLALQSGDLDSGKPQVLKALHKYLIRLCTRSTPFGLFAGHCLGNIDEKTRVAFSRKERFTINSTLDSEFLFRLSRPILKKEALVNQVKFYPNSSLYPVMDGYRYIERTTEPREGFLLSALTQTQYLSLVLAHAKHGLTLRELTALLIKNKAPKKKVLPFIHSLIDAQVLASALEMNATGESYFQRLKKGFESIPDLAKDLDTLHTIEKILGQQTNLVAAYEKIKSITNPNLMATAPRHILQTDLVFNTESCQISSTAFDRIQNDLQQLLPIAQKNSHPDLRQFARKLFEKFGNKPLALLKALDPASGTGFGTLHPTAADGFPLLEGLSITLQTPAVKQPDSPFTRLQKTVLERAMKDKLKVIALSSDDFALFSGPESSELPENFYLLGSIIAESETAVDSGDFLFDLKAMAGPTGLSLMTRFCQANPALEARLRQAAKSEQQPDSDTLYAEICHATDSRSLNILKRPSLYAYEIPYLASSSVDADFQIQPGELLVCSPDGIQIMLTCPRLGKRIIPRLSSAHDYSGGLPLYRFLCELAQDENGIYLDWHWPDPMEETFFPRVTFKHLILQKATWHLEGRIHQKLTGNIQDILSAWQTVSQELNLPRYFQIQQGDNELLIDGQNIFCLQLLIDYLKKSKTLRLIEYLPDSTKGFITESGHAINHEIVIPFTCKQSKNKHKITKTAYAPESYSLGSEWLYAKIYCSPQAADFILTRIILGFCDRLHRKGIVREWFFIRYFDPEPHLRVRMKLGDRSSQRSLVLQQLHKALEPHTNSGLIRALNIDTYTRETDRYTLLPYDKLETIFDADSNMVCRCLRALSQHQDPNFKWLLALRGCDELLSSLDLNITEKANVISGLHLHFTDEFGKDLNSVVILDKKYRHFKKNISDILNPSTEQVSQIQEFTKFFDHRTTIIRYALQSTENKTSESLKDLASNLVHLSLNRWFNTEQRRQEWVIYHFLKKYYDTILNLSKKQKNQPV